MKSKTDEITEKAFHHALNFFKSNDRGLDNQDLCLKQLMELTGFDYETCLKIQNPVLSLYMAFDTMSIGQSVIESNMQMVTQTIHNHLLNVTTINSINTTTGINSINTPNFCSLSSANNVKAFDSYVLKKHGGGLMGSNGRHDLYSSGNNLAMHEVLYRAQKASESGWGANGMIYVKAITLYDDNIKDFDIDYMRSVLGNFVLNLDALYLNRNQISDLGASHLLNGLINAPAYRNVINLNLSENQISDKGAELLAGSISRGEIPELRCLDVSGNQITAKGYGHFAEALNSTMVKDIVLILETIDFLTKGGKYYSDQLVQHFKSFQINKIRSNMPVDKWQECKEMGANIGKSAVSGFVKGILTNKNKEAALFLAVKEAVIDNILTPEALYCYIDTKELVGEVLDQNCTIF